MKKTAMFILITAFLAIITALPLLSLVSEKSELSVYENRFYAGMPVLSVETFWSGEYFAEWEKYLSDSTYKRDLILKSHAALELSVLGKNVVNGILVTDEALLKYVPPNENTYDYTDPAALMADDLAGLREYINSYGGEFVFIGVPDQYSMFRDLYPQGLNNSDLLLCEIEDSFFSALEERGIPYINMRQEYINTGEPAKYYAKADHHYNLYGALYACEKLWDKLDGLGIPVAKSLPGEEEIIRLPNEYQGSRERQLCFLPDVKDEFLVWTPTVPFRR